MSNFIAPHKPVHLLFSRGTGFYAWLIRLWTNSPWSHVAIAFRKEDFWWVCEASPKTGVKVYPLRDITPGLYLDVPTEVGLTQLVEDFFFTRVQLKPYDWIDAIRAGIGLAPRNRGYQCAELVQDLYTYAGGKLPGAPTPASILSQLQSMTPYAEAIIHLP